MYGYCYVTWLLCQYLIPLLLFKTEINLRQVEMNLSLIYLFLKEAKGAFYRIHYIFP